MSINVLIVDDSSIVRKVIERTLGMTGLDLNPPLTAEHGAQALEVLRSNWVDLIFLDVNMPVMDGMEFMEHLRADEAFQDIPVIIVSTEGSHERRAKLEEHRIHAYLRKPVTPEAIVNAVNSALGGAA